MNETKSTKRVLRVSVAALLLVVLVGVSMTGSAAAISGCQELNTQGQTYEVTQNIENQTISTCLDITAPDIVLDGQGHKVNGVNETQSSTGILVAADNVTVKNFGNVTGWADGIVVTESDNSTLANNTANNNEFGGIQVEDSDDNDLIDNTAKNNGAYGIGLFGSSDNDLIDNTANENGRSGIELLGESDFNDLIDNEARDNSRAEGSSAGILLESDSPGPDNNTLVDNTATGDQTHGIRLSGSDDNELRDNTANENNVSGIYLTDSSDNELIDNVANDNGLGAPALVEGIYGIWLEDESNNNTLTRNEAFDNGPRTRFVEQPLEDSEIRTNNEVGGTMSAGIYLGGLAGNPVRNNTLTENEVRDTDTIGETEGGFQDYGIWLTRAIDNKLIDNTASENLQYGIWLTQNARNNTLIDNVAENNGPRIELVSTETTEAEGDGSTTTSPSEENPSAGIYVGGAIVTPEGANNTLVNNTVRRNDYGIWIKNSFGNDVSESLAEDNQEGIAVEIDSINRLDSVSPAQEPEITLAGNTFTNDTSRNNDEWDFVVDVPETFVFGGTNPDSTGTLDTDIPVEAFPVTNLDIGESTKPETTLSFLSPNVRLRSVRNPIEPDPSGLTNIGRYFEAERTVTEIDSVEPEQHLPPLLSVAVSYENADIRGVDESTLEIRRYNETAGEWQALENPLLNQTDNLVAGLTIDTSNFGVFGEPACINRRSLSRGEKDQQCPFDKTIQRRGSRRGLDRSSGRSGEGRHSDSETARRDRSRGERGGRSR